MSVAQYSLKMAVRKRQAVIDDLSNDEVTPRAKPRPRKKQAVTKTNNTAIKALSVTPCAKLPNLIAIESARMPLLPHYSCYP